MKINLTKYLFFLSIFFILTIFFLGLNINPRYDTRDLVGKKIDNFQYENFNKNGEILTNKILKNKNSLINFWASWCAPCRLEHKFLVDIKNKSNLYIVGINYKDNKDNAQNFLNELGNPYDLIGLDKDGVESVKFGIYGIPETILINKNQVVIKKYIGPLSEDNIKEIIETIKK